MIMPLYRIISSETPKTYDPWIGKVAITEYKTFTHQINTGFCEDIFWRFF